MGPLLDDLGEAVLDGHGVAQDLQEPGVLGRVQPGQVLVPVREVAPTDAVEVLGRQLVGVGPPRGAVSLRLPWTCSAGTNPGMDAS